MKKFYAIVLGLLMVLGLASVASAEFAISGQFVVKGVYNTEDAPAWGGLDTSLGDCRFELKFTATYENVSADLKFRMKDQALTYDPVEDEYSLSDYVQVRTANMFYNFSDAFKLGITYDVTGDLQVYESLVDSEWDWEYDGMDALLRGDVAMGDFKASFVTDLYEQEFLFVRAGGTYNLDPITIGCGINIVDEFYEIMPGVKYALSDELSFDGEVYYNEAEVLLIGAGVNYATDALSIEGGFFYDMTEGVEDLAYYFIYASYSVTDNVDLYFNYFDKEATMNPADYNLGFEVGATIYLDSNDKSSIDINYVEDQNDPEDPGAHLTFTFKVGF